MLFVFRQSQMTGQEAPKWIDYLFIYLFILEMYVAIVSKSHLKTKATTPEQPDFLLEISKYRCIGKGHNSHIY